MAGMKGPYIVARSQRGIQSGREEHLFLTKAEFQRARNRVLESAGVKKKAKKTRKRK